MAEPVDESDSYRVHPCMLASGWFYLGGAISMVAWAIFLDWLAEAVK